MSVIIENWEIPLLFYEYKTGTGVQYFLFFIFLQSPKISLPLEYNSLFLVIYYYLTFFLTYAKISILKIKQIFLKGFIYVSEYFL